MSIATNNPFPILQHLEPPMMELQTFSDLSRIPYRVPRFEVERAPVLKSTRSPTSTNSYGSWQSYGSPPNRNIIHNRIDSGMYISTQSSSSSAYSSGGQLPSPMGNNVVVKADIHTETKPTEASKDEVVQFSVHSLASRSRLPDTDNLPWTFGDCLDVLQSGRCSRYSEAITTDCWHFVAYILSRPLLRFAHEAYKLSSHFGLCTEREMKLAIELLLEDSLYEKCMGVVDKALRLFSRRRHSALNQQCGLHFSVGRMFRWLVDAKVAKYVDLPSAVVLTAVMQFLLEEIVINGLSCRPKENSERIEIVEFEKALKRNRGLWALLRSQQQIVFCQEESLPSSTDITSIITLEQVLSKGSSPFKWSDGALCSLWQLISETATQLKTKRRHRKTNQKNAKFPSLSHWQRLSNVFAKSRFSQTVEQDDVMKTSQILLPLQSQKPRNVDSPSSAAGQGATNGQALTPLMEACFRGDKSRVCSLLDLGANANTTVSLDHPHLIGWTALHFACIHGNVDIAKILLEYIRTIQRCSAIDSPLHIACATGDLSMVELLLHYGWNPLQEQLRPSCPLTPLSLAALHGHCDVVRLLFTWCLDRGMFEIKRYNEQENDYVQIEELYKDVEAKRQMDGDEEERYCAVFNGEQLRLLKDTLRLSAETGHRQITMFLSNVGVSWSTHDWYLTLYSAFEEKDYDQVEILLKNFDSIKDENSLDDLKPLLLLMFELIRLPQKHIQISQLAARQLNKIFGSEPIPPIKRLSFVGKDLLSNEEILVELKDGTLQISRALAIQMSGLFESLITKERHRICLHDVPLDLFQHAVKFYTTKSQKNFSLDHCDLVELFDVSLKLGLRELFRHCEYWCALNLNQDDCINHYKIAIKHGATELSSYCEMYFLRNLPQLTECHKFKKLLFSKRTRKYNALNRMVELLAEKVTNRFSRYADFRNLRPVML